MRIRPTSPEGVVRPFRPSIGLTDPVEQLADALDKIAVTLASIDHNLEVLTNHIGNIRST